MARFSKQLDGSQNYLLHLDVTLTAQNAADNTSTFGWVLSVEDVNNWGSFSGAQTSWNVNIGGAVRSGTIASVPAGNFTIASGSVTRTHSAGGTLLISVSGYWDSKHSNIGKGSATGQVSAPTIARASVSTFSSGSSVNMGQTVTVTTNRASSSYLHTIWLGHNLSNVIIGENVGASTSWTVPTDLLDSWPNHEQVQFNVWTRTLLSDARVGADQKTLLLVKLPASAVPQVASLTATDMNSDVSTIVGRFVQGLSRAKLTVTGSGVNGSTIVAAEATMLGATVASGGKVAVSASGNLTITGKVTDSRGRVGTSSSVLSVLPYTPPSVSAYQARRSNASGVLQDDGAYLRVDLTATIASLINSTQRNAITVRAFTRARGTTVWTARNVITPAGLTYNTSFVVSGGAVFAPTSSWDVRVEVRDKFGVYVADTTVATADVTLDLGPNGVGVGKIHEQGALDVAGDVYAGGVLLLPAASNTETKAGTSVVKAVTPASLQSKAATQPEADAGTSTTRFVSPKTLRDRAYAAYAEAAGSVEAASWVTVTLPAGRFTQPPIVTPQLNSPASASIGVTAMLGNVTSTSFQTRTSSGASFRIDWRAVQMTAGSASG